MIEFLSGDTFDRKIDSLLMVSFVRTGTAGVLQMDDINIKAYNRIQKSKIKPGTCNV